MKKGFTIVELLVVIVILAILMIIATPAVLSVAQQNKAKMYCKKIKTVVKSAQLYGEEYFDYIDKTVAGENSFLIDSNTTCSINGTTMAHCQITTIGSLADRGFLKLEKVGKSSFETEFLDPRNFKSMLSDRVMIYIVNKRVNAQFIYNSKKDGDKCADSVQVGNARYKSYYYKQGGTIKSN